MAPISNRRRVQWSGITKMQIPILDPAKQMNCWIILRVCLLTNLLLSRAVRTLWKLNLKYAVILSCDFTYYKKTRKYILLLLIFSNSFDHVQGVSKGLVVEKLLSTMVDGGKPPDFLMCIGDDRSDEDMFESVSNRASCPLLPAVPEIYACTVGQKPSKAKYYLDDTVDVIKLLTGLAAASNKKPKHSHIQVSFESSA